MRTDRALIAAALAVVIASPSWAQPAPGEGSLLRPEPTLTCEGLAAPVPEGEAFPPLVAGNRAPEAATLTFSIDAEGRTRDIRPLPQRPGPVPPEPHAVAQATIAGWRFPAGAPAECRVEIRHRFVRLAEADPNLLLRFFGVTRTTGPLRQATGRRLGGPNGDCQDDPPSLRRAGFPGLHPATGRRGVREWTVTRWSFDDAGRSHDVEVIGGSGNAALDADAVQAHERTVAEPDEPRTGCVYNWYRRGGVLPAPPMPEPPADTLARCPASVLSTFRVRGQGLEANEFISRGIEGWALVRFDIAPSGAVGNVAVLDAQPAGVFGSIAEQAVQMGRAGEGDGAIRCLQPVLFRVPADD